MTDEQISHMYECLVLQGKLHIATQWIPQHDKGELLQPDDIDANTQMLALDVLK
jgi:hypothetical protein